MVIRIDGDKLFSCAIQNTKRRRVQLFELSHEHTPTNVSIGVRWKTCIEVLHKEGRYGSASEIIREGLRQPDSNALWPQGLIPEPQFIPAPDRRLSQALVQRYQRTAALKSSVRGFRPGVF